MGDDEAKQKENCSNLSQKQQKALFNNPRPRLELIPTPYPAHTQFQLSMRRKTEILQYDNARQNTKTNNMTKQQKYAYFASISVNRNTIPQNGFPPNGGSIISPKIVNCLLNRTTPTSTTACDVPGPPIILQYDPTVPLYDYKNNQESFAIVYSKNNVLYSQYTKNIVEYLNTELDFVQPDVSLSYQTFTTQLGSLVTNDTNNDNTTFNIKTPIAVWFNGSIGSGYDRNGIRIVKPNVILQDFINIHITNARFEIWYNNDLITPITTPTVSFSPVDCSFNLSNVQDMFYGVQYVGMMNISNLVLNTPPNSVYSFQFVFTYTYDNIIAYKLDYLKTGVYSNLQTRTDPEYLFNCTLNSPPPNNFKNATFSQFI